MLFNVIFLLLFLQKLFYDYYFIQLIFFHENYFYCFIFQDVPACSGMFRNVPCS